MRIGFEMEHFDSTRGGAETYVARFIPALLAAGHEVHLFAGNAAMIPAGVHLHQVRPHTADAVRHAIAAAGLDVVVSTGKGLGMNVFQPHGGTFLGSRRQNLAMIRNPLLRRLRAWLNAIIPKHRAAARLERRQYTQQHPRPRFVAISRMVRQDMQTFYSVPDERLHLVYNGVDTEQFSPARCAALREPTRRQWGIAPDTVCFLLVAHNFRLKGVRELIEAAGEIARQRRDFAVVVVGRGNARSYQRLAARCGCGDLVRFPGPISDAVPAYAAADVYVQPTWYDPCSLVVLEAWACGLPVITTRFNGAGELMTEGREGFLIDTPADTQALAARMTDLLDAGLRGRMSRDARALAERNSQENNFRAMMQVFERAAADSAREADPARPVLTSVPPPGARCEGR